MALRFDPQDPWSPLSHVAMRDEAPTVPYGDGKPIIDGVARAEIELKAKLHGLPLQQRMLEIRNWSEAMRRVLNDIHDVSLDGDHADDRDASSVNSIWGDMDAGEEQGSGMHTPLIPAVQRQMPTDEDRPVGVPDFRTTGFLRDSMRQNFAQPPSDPMAEHEWDIRRSVYGAPPVLPPFSTPQSAQSMPLAMGDTTLFVDQQADMDQTGTVGGITSPRTQPPHLSVPMVAGGMGGLHSTVTSAMRTSAATTTTVSWSMDQLRTLGGIMVSGTTRRDPMSVTTPWISATGGTLPASLGAMATSSVTVPRHADPPSGPVRGRVQFSTAQRPTGAATSVGFVNTRETSGNVHATVPMGTSVAGPTGSVPQYGWSPGIASMSGHPHGHLVSRPMPTPWLKQNPTWNTPHSDLAAQPVTQLRTTPGNPASSYQLRADDRQNPAQKQKKIPPYDGKDSWSDYLVQFEIVATMNRWTEDQKAQELATNLTGRAREVLTDLSPQDRLNFSALVSKLAMRFEPKDLTGVHQSQLRSYRRKRNQSVPELMQEVSKLVRKAFPSADDDTRNFMAVSSFITALHHETQELFVFQRDPRTLEDAGKAAMAYETFYMDRLKPGSGQVRAQQMVKDHQPIKGVPLTQGVDHPVESVRNDLKDLAGQIASMQKQLGKPAASQPGRRQHNQGSTGNRRRTGPCWRCDEVGHWARECPQNPHRTGRANMESTQPQTDVPAATEPTVSQDAGNAD